MRIKPKQYIDISKREIALEIYRQKYQTFRHFDQLRWQLPAIALPAGSAILGLATDGDGLPYWWAMILFGLISWLSGYAIYRVRLGIAKNREILDLIAMKIGDYSIPPTKHSGGATWFFTIFMMTLGIAGIGLGIWSALCDFIKVIFRNNIYQLKHFKAQKDSGMFFDLLVHRHKCRSNLD